MPKTAAYARVFPSDLPFDPEDVRPTWCRVVERTRVRELGGVVRRFGDGLEEVGSVRVGAHGTFEAVRIAVNVEVDAFVLRSEERRVGKECRSRWWQYG